ncbi:MAG TPA: hypothetical protein VH331_09270 [Allosphingosinicella sp.]|jgi:hypothetical protein|nr:hypothetical protein [Allosphingosinicella sp.]
MARKPTKRQIEASESYLFRIESLHSQYSFGDGYKLLPTAYSEHLHPEIEATCLAPTGYKDRPTRFTLIGDRRLEQDLWMQKHAVPHELGVGTLTMRGSQSHYLGAVPYDAAWRIQPLILAGGLRFIYLHGAAMRHGSASIGSISFYQEFDRDEA